jgi:hypothetical protein
MDIYSALREVELDADDFVVVGSSVLRVLGLLDGAGDIDLCVSPSTFEKLERLGWQKNAGQGGKPVLRKGVFDVGIGFGQYCLEDLQADALVINDVSFVSLEKLKS